MYTTFVHIHILFVFSPNHTKIRHKKNILKWCGLYHLLVGICENGYPLAHIPTDK